MDAKFQTIHRQLAAEDEKLLVLAKTVYALLHYDTVPLDEEKLGELRYKLDEAFGFEL